MKSFWIGVASREHVLKAVEGGFCQFSHGSAAAVERAQPGGGIAYYSPSDQMRGGDIVQAFTAIGIVGEGGPEQATQSEQFRPSRRKVAYADAKDAPIKPLPASSPSPRDARIGGRRSDVGLLSVDVADFALIAEAMGAPDMAALNGPLSRK